MRISEYLPWIIVTFASLLFVSAIFPKEWPQSVKTIFRVIVAVSFFFGIGAYWLTTGEKFDETAYKSVLCRLHSFERCVSASSKIESVSPVNGSAQTQLTQDALNRIKYEQVIRGLSGWVEVDYRLPIDQAIKQSGVAVTMNPIVEPSGNDQKQIYMELFSCDELAAETEADVWKALANRNYRPATGRELLAFVAKTKELPPPVGDNLFYLEALGGVRADDYRRWTVTMVDTGEYRMLLSGSVWDGCRDNVYLLGVPK